MPIGCAMKNKEFKKKICRGVPPNLIFRFRRTEGLLSNFFIFKLKSKGDDVIPIDSHVTSEEEKRKLYLTYFHILNFNFKKNSKKF